MLEKTRSRSLIERPPKVHFSKKRRKPLNRKRKFHAKDNPTKRYATREIREVRAFAVQCRIKRLETPTEAEEVFTGIMENLRQISGKEFEYEREKIFYYADRFIIADFFINTHSLIIEIDGGAHTSQEEYDYGRDKYFEGYGLRTARFTNAQVLRRPQEVEAHLREILNATSSSPSPK